MKSFSENHFSRLFVELTHYISYKCWEPVMFKWDISTCENHLSPAFTSLGRVSATLLSQEENLLLHDLEQCSCEGELGGKGTKQLWDTQPSWNSSTLFSKGFCEENQSSAQLLEPAGKLWAERKMGLVASPCCLLACVVRPPCSSAGWMVFPWWGGIAGQDGGSLQSCADAQEQVAAHQGMPWATEGFRLPVHPV